MGALGRIFTGLAILALVGVVLVAGLTLLYAYNKEPLPLADRITRGQRSLLFWDALRQRGDNTLAHERAGHPLLLKFPYDMLIVGRDLPHPVNYSLRRIIPGPNQPTDDTRRRWHDLGAERLSRKGGEIDE